VKWIPTFRSGKNWLALPALCAREEGPQLLADDLVMEGLLRVAALVLGHEISGRDRSGEARRRRA
jgi:hypothetical protein